MKVILRRIIRRSLGALLEMLIWVIGHWVPTQQDIPHSPQSILILRNNDLGDLLIITPLFQALRQRFPDAQIVAGVGSWSADILTLNPYLSEVIPVNAPWFNRVIPNQTVWNALKYILFSPESKELATRRFDIGIDIFGSRLGVLLLLRTRIPYRLGVKGYAGGHSAVQQAVNFNPYEQVGRSALRFAELLGATHLPECRPQLFLSDAEREQGERQWTERSSLQESPRRIVIAPGGGYLQKCWPPDFYEALVRSLSELNHLEILIIGGPQDREVGERLAAIGTGVRSHAGNLKLRETFAVLATADFVICNSSMAMHAAAAFHKPTLVLLGEDFESTSQHEAQWGYPGTCKILGKEPGHRDTIYTPPEVFKQMQQWLMPGEDRQ